MKTFKDFADTPELMEWYKLLLPMYMLYLQVIEEHDVEFAGELVEPVEELWELPKNFICEVEMRDVSVPGFSVGYVAFGTINGVRHVFEQNASPFLVWRAPCK